MAMTNPAASRVDFPEVQIASGLVTTRNWGAVGLEKALWIPARCRQKHSHQSESIQAAQAAVVVGAPRDPPTLLYRACVGRDPSGLLGLVGSRETNAIS